MRNTLLLSILLTLFSVYLIKRTITFVRYSHLNPFESHISALILARGGSKGIKLKNLAKIHNVTLLARTIRTIHDFGLFDSVWVSTDHEEIAKEAEKNGANVHWRKPFTTLDEASSSIAVKEFIQSHSEIGIVGLIQCTSPFLRVSHLREAYDKLLVGYHSVFSVTRDHKLRWRIEDNIIEPDNFDPYNRPRRQDWDGELYENGMFYFTYTDIIFDQEVLQGGKASVVEIPNNESLEIDTIEDLRLAECLSIQ
ncbi:N-acylneuraminate cytidylyltransferase A [Cimex lectularius]|uniref:N-acylneuraminate cytidylyltransferase n=1 Tax=Cimex lectularius TaxID=79782 RepID=A0A8I6RVW0_CIMLE|nr:N-acylneuraminate cytidylyltransferase A [Cimex lectularius]